MSFPSSEVNFLRWYWLLQESACILTLLNTCVQLVVPEFATGLKFNCRCSVSRPQELHGDDLIMTGCPDVVLKQVAEKKARHKRLSDVFSLLKKHKLEKGEEVSVRPIHKKGQQETRKEKHLRMTKLQELGLPVMLSNAVTLKGLHTNPSNSGDSESELEEVCSEHSSPELNTPYELSPLNEEGTAEVRADTCSEDGSDPRPGVLSDNDLAEKVRKTRECLDMDRDEILDECVEDLAGKVALTGPHRVVTVTRRADIEECRSNLPIIGLEQEIMEAVNGYDVMVLCGQTGCGKTTQVPQFLYEAGYGCKLYPEKSGMIGVTQPRRVAAISTAERVADEMDSNLGAIVGYQVKKRNRYTLLRILLIIVL